MAENMYVVRYLDTTAPSPLSSAWPSSSSASSTGFRLPVPMASITAADDLRLKTHVDHAIRLIENDVVALSEHRVPPIDNIYDTTRRTD